MAAAAAAVFSGLPRNTRQGCSHRRPSSVFPRALMVPLFLHAVDPDLINTESLGSHKFSSSTRRDADAASTHPPSCRGRKCLSHPLRSRVGTRFRPPVRVFIDSLPEESCRPAPPPDFRHRISRFLSLLAVVYRPIDSGAPCRRYGHRASVDSPS